MGCSIEIGIIFSWPIGHLKSRLVKWPQVLLHMEMIKLFIAISHHFQFYALLFNFMMRIHRSIDENVASKSTHSSMSHSVFSCKGNYKTFKMYINGFTSSNTMFIVYSPGRENIVFGIILLHWALKKLRTASGGQIGLEPQYVWIEYKNKQRNWIKLETTVPAYLKHTLLCIHLRT